MANAEQRPLRQRFEPDFRDRAISVVVVDDFEGLRRYVVTALLAIGLDAHGVEDMTGLQGAIARRTPDLVLLDWILQQQPATEELALLRERQIPVIILTGDPEEVRELDVPVLAKPVTLNQLYRRLDQVLGRPAG